MEKIQDINLVRRELKNIRQELMKQKASMKQEISEIRDLILKNNSAVDGPLNSNKQDGAITKLEEEKYTMSPIGFVRSCFASKNGIPRQPSLCPDSKATLTIEKSLFTNPEHSLIGLGEFSHIWVLFVFHKNGEQKSVKAKIHPPRLDGASTGVFSTRSPHRPCPIGLSLIKLDKVEDSTLFLSGIDLLDGTPVLDIKPFIPMYDTPYLGKNIFETDQERIGSPMLPLEQDTTHPKIASNSNCSVPPHLRETSNTLQVLFTPRAMEDLQGFHAKSSHGGYCERCMSFASGPLDAKRAIVSVLENDPRSVYRRRKCSDKLYYFSLDNLHVTCWYDEDLVEVLKIKPVSS